ncbi:hypothetical protein [Bradyrhizobium sp. CCBAU 11361]|uniref:hypothetical protein n=1 Tax=Bradyrhizobium sp. CCBAU 11361 TaxID=1630812 RepID=UPI0023033242|nr:hypothetical protein [Bradyrhizobium sp. CCBAU 11361]MDA9488737.1 hypothetical protein [Bradyrhizobium sp. CCBAU 11361]
MNKRDDQRAQEVNNLKLELATFALRLDAFEARTRNQLAKSNAEPSKLVLPDSGLAKQST